MSEPEDTPGTNIRIATLPNLRDLGGYRVNSGGTVRRGVLYRSVELGRMDDADLELFRDLGVKTVFDLRTDAEREKSPDRDAGQKEVALNVLADADGAAPARLLQLAGNPAGAEEMLGDGKAKELFLHAYSEFIDLPSADAAFSRFFTGIAETEELPALIHCTTGKDRTGWAAASLLLFLGVSEDDVVGDYLRTNDQLLPALKPLVDNFEAQGGDPELLRPVLGVDPDYLEVTLGMMNERYGSIDGYVSEALGLDDEAQQAIHDRLVER